MDMGLGKLQQWVMDREAWHAVVYGVAKSQDTTEQLNWTELNQLPDRQLSWKLLTSVPLTFSLVYVCSAMADSLRPHGL